MDQLVSLDYNPMQSQARRRIGLLMVLLGTAGYGVMLSSYLGSFGRAANLAGPACLIYGFVYLWRVTKSTTRPAITGLTGLLILNLLALLNAQLLAMFYLPILDGQLAGTGVSRPVLFLIFYGFGLELAKLERLIIVRGLVYLPWHIKKHYYLFVDELRIYHLAVHQAGHHYYAKQIWRQSEGTTEPHSHFFYRNQAEGRTVFDHSASSDQLYTKYLLSGGIAETIFFGFQLGEDHLELESDYGLLRAGCIDDYSAEISEIIEELGANRYQLQRWATELVETGFITAAEA